MQATLSHYRILEEIGKGGMGVVYRAHDEGTLDRDVAVKVLPSGALADEGARRRFRKEATALSKLNHPNIATVFDFDSDNGTDFLVEELIPGLSLSEMLVSGPLPEREIVNLGSQLCEGLAAAHEQGVIHRDLKPANIRVTPDARLKILDFGLAKVLHKTVLGTDATASLTETQTVSGTFPYMAPEQLLNEKLDARADIWAAGCVLYEMATGQRPFAGSGMALADSILHQGPAAPSKFNRKVTPNLEDIILKCLEKDPALRYASARDIAVDLHRLGTGSMTKALPVQKRPALHRVTIAITLLLVISAFAVWYWKYRHEAIDLASPRSVAVLSFRNVSGDQSLDWLGGGLVEMLTTNLSQVKGMDVLSTEQVWRMLKQKGHQDATKLTTEMALDVARDAGADTCVTGSLMRLGPSRLRVDLHLQDTRTGRILFSDKVESADINGIFAMVDAMTARLAEHSLPPPQVPSVTPAIEQVTTSNVEALRHYQAATDYGLRLRFEKAAREYEEAVRLDPQFASAYFGLRSAYANLGDSAKRLDALHRLESLQSRLPHLQQLQLQSIRSIEAGDRPAVIQVRETILQEFPRDGGNRLGLAVSLLPQQPDRAVALVREGVALTPKDAVLVSQAPYVYAVAGDEAAALEACDRYEALAGKNEPNVWDTRGDVHYIFQHDEEAVAAQRHALELDPQWAKPNAKLALYYSDQGKSAQAAEEWRRYQDEVTGIYRVGMPMLESVLSQLQGNPEAALEKYKSAIIALEQAAQSSMAYDALAAYSVLSLLLGQQSTAADFARRQRLQGQELLLVSFLEAANGNESASDTALRQFSEAKHEVSTFVIDQQRHLNRALIALRHRDPDAASRALRDLKEVFPRGAVLPVLFNFAVLVRGRTYLLVKDYPAAERDLTSLARGVRNMGNPATRRLAMPLYEHLCHFYLGQIYEETDRRDDAIREYHSFLSHYTHSRSRLPEIAQARAALKRLGS